MTSPSPQLALELPLEKAATFERFVVGRNQAALASLREAAQGAAEAWPLLTGSAGTGKTHLLNATCHLAHLRQRRSMLLTAAHLSARSPAVVAQLTTVDLLAIDDIDQLIGDQRWDEALFHLFNDYHQRGATLVLSGRTDFAALRPSLPDLRTRLGWGVVLKLHGLSEQGAVELLRTRAASKGMVLSDGVISYIIRRAPRNAKALVGVIDRIETRSLIEQRRVTVPFVRSLFPEFIRNEK